MKSTNKDTIDQELASTLRIAREQKAMTQEDVAALAGLTATFYAMMERGEANPSVVNLEKVLKVLGLKMLVKKA